MSISATPAELSDKQRRILNYLRSATDRRTYFKSRLIGREVGLSSKEVGSNMRALAEGDIPLDIEKWGYSSSTTWKVTR